MLFFAHVVSVCGVCLCMWGVLFLFFVIPISHSSPRPFFFVTPGFLLRHPGVGRGLGRLCRGLVSGGNVEIPAFAGMTIQFLRGPIRRYDEEWDGTATESDETPIFIGVT